MEIMTNLLNKMLNHVNVCVNICCFLSLIFFSGYGHMVPLSLGSQIFAILFSLVGIPLTVFFLGIIATMFNKPSQNFLEFLMNKLSKYYDWVSVHCISTKSCPRGVHIPSTLNKKQKQKIASKQTNKQTKQKTNCN